MVPIVTAQISQLVNQIAIAVSDITGEPIDQALIDEILAGIDIDAIVDQITAKVQVSLGILEACLELIPPPPPPIEGATLSINKEWFVCNNDDIDSIQIPEQQISFEGPNSGNYTQCTSDAQCPFANNAGFNITINGTSPTPNTIPARINTMQDVDIGAGPFSMTEELFSDRIVPNAINIENVPVGDMTADDPTFNIAFDAAGQRVFTANAFNNSISIIDLRDNSVTNVDLSASGGDGPFEIAFDAAGQRVFTANEFSSSVSIIELGIFNNVIDVPLGPGNRSPEVIIFDEVGQRVFTANGGTDTVTIINLTNSNTVTPVNIGLSGGFNPEAIAFDQEGQRVFTGNTISDSLSIIELANSNNVTNVDLENNPHAIAFDQPGQRVFTANGFSNSVSIIDLANANTVTNIPLLPTGGDGPISIAFDAAGQRVFTANEFSDSVSIIELANSNNVIHIPLLPTGGDRPFAIAFDQVGQRLFTANRDSDSVSIIDLANANTVTNIPLLPTGGDGPISIAFDAAGQRVFTANGFSDSVSIIDLLSLVTVSKICQDSGFDTGDIRTFVSGQQTLEQITCVNFVGECSGNIDDGETRECTVEDYIVNINDITDDGIGILANTNNP